MLTAPDVSMSAGALAGVIIGESDFLVTSFNEGGEPGPDCLKLTFWLLLLWLAVAGESLQCVQSRWKMNTTFIIEKSTLRSSN